MEERVLPIEVYTTQEVAKMFKVSNGTVRDWCHSGRMRGVKQHGQWRIDADAIREFHGVR